MIQALIYLSVLERERLILWLNQQILNKDLHWFAAILHNHLKALHPFRIVIFLAHPYLEQ